MMTSAARLCVEAMSARAQRVLFVHGMRRSGNHACVGWLVNALENQEVTLVEDAVTSNFNYSDSGQTFFVNDVSTISGANYLRALRRNFGKIRKARFIIISAEDEDATYADNWRIPRRSRIVFVHRNTLNLMASRFQNLNRRAREGWGASMQSMKPKFFATLKACIESPRGHVWEFEKWHDDAQWRERFLADIGLQCDIRPHMVGLGSSFSHSRSLPDTDQMAKRFMMVEPYEAWVSFIRNAAARYPELFTASEHESISAMTSSEHDESTAGPA